ncbi:MFS transporter [Mycobacterium gordonae]|jgi:EmrB/QacA subfamily drug resistance transporter|uniref:MFS transporter n=1 Tax=Mycobacterium gordonae TaxID=1778 RepID=A0A1A6BB78_MYCGO|nr:MULTISPECIES: DHA2 family efflux MFS transporter permease subunit [Mycobacterium]MBI2698553.1 DHA2 family efflux MFS transporter permease subunit [Mycobacterium sp.]OBR99535.1 MFS transporter [Mycobacterium gordonae]
MLSNAMEKAPSAPADAVLPTTATGKSIPGDYPERLDAATLRVAGVCILASVMLSVDTTVVSVAQRTFIVQFESTQTVVGWTMTGYTLALATVIPLAGWAADRFGTKRLWMGSVVAFMLGSLLCAIAPTILLLNVFRAVQGMCGGMLMPLGFTILTHVAGPKRLGRLMSVLGIPMLLGPIGGPILGGWLINAFSWPWIFLINLPIGLCAFLLAKFIFPRDQPAPSETFDAVGVLLLSPGLAMFLFGVSSIPGRGTLADRHVLVPAIIGLALITAFVVHALHRADHPLIDLRLFRIPAVTHANVTALIFSIAFFGSLLLIPSYLQQVLGQTPMQSGLHLIPQGLGAMLTMPWAGIFMDRKGPGRSVLLGISLITVGLAVFTVGVARQADYSPVLLLGLGILGMGMGCTMMPLSGASVQALAPHEIARGSTLISVNFQVGGSIGTALMSMVLTSQFNRSQNISAANEFVRRQENAARRGVPVDPSGVPQRTLQPDFATGLLHDLSHAYTVVMLIAVALVAATLIPASFLPKKPAA